MEWERKLSFLHDFWNRDVLEIAYHLFIEDKKDIAEKYYFSKKKYDELNANGQKSENKTEIKEQFLELECLAMEYGIIDYDEKKYNFWRG